MAIIRVESSRLDKAARKRFGSWAGALTAAGPNPDGVRKGPKRAGGTCRGPVKRAAGNRSEVLNQNRSIALGSTWPPPSNVHRYCTVDGA